MLCLLFVTHLAKLCHFVLKSFILSFQSRHFGHSFYQAWIQVYLQEDERTDNLTYISEYRVYTSYAEFVRGLEFKEAP